MPNNSKSTPQKRKKQREQAQKKKNGTLDIASTVTRIRRRRSA